MSSRGKAPDNKNIKLNMLLNAIKGLLSVLFPLITFPYVSRVLGVDNLGRYSFSNSIVSYFVLLGGLGINTYAIREGSRLRNDKVKIESFANEMFTINLASSFVACVMYLGIAFLQADKYKPLFYILSFLIVFKAIGIEWIYSIYEDYLYITVRSILVQLISLILLFLFVKTDQDTNKYVMIVVGAAVGADILNFLYGRRYCGVRLTSKVDIRSYIKPILILFAMSATVTIYVSSDITILGILCDDYTVGIYAVSTKIYSIIKTILSSVLIVSIPRLSALLGQNKEKEYQQTASEIYKVLMTLLFPVMVGIIALRKEIIFLVASDKYARAQSSLMLLGVALLFCMGAWFWGQCILVPNRKEKTVFLITVISALTNIVLNLLLIPHWKENAAAFTTILAEGISFALCCYFGKKTTRLSGIVLTFAKVLAGCLLIIIICWVTRRYSTSYIVNLVVAIPASIIAYFISQKILHNEALNSRIK